MCVIILYKISYKRKFLKHILPTKPHTTYLCPTGNNNKQTKKKKKTKYQNLWKNKDPYFISYVLCVLCKSRFYIQKQNFRKFIP